MLRQVFRETARTGNYEIATVEQSALGVATVLVPGSNRRYTNLPVIGTPVVAGDTVIIDFSSDGPSVYLKQDKGEPDQPNLALAQAVPPHDYIEDVDVGCATGMYFYGQYPVVPHANYLTPFLLPFGYNDYPVYDYWTFGQLWDTSNFHNYLQKLGPDHVTIPITAKYIVSTYWNWLISETAWYGTQIIEWLRIRTLKNYTDPIHQEYHRWDAGGCQAGILIMTVESLEAGDKLSMELYHSFDKLPINNPDYSWEGAPETIDSWPFYHQNYNYGYLRLTIQMIPGTEE